MSKISHQALKDLRRWGRFYGVQLLPFLLTAVALFFFFILIGFGLGSQETETQTEIMTELTNLAAILRQLSELDLMIVIWVNNMLVLLLAMLGGFLLGLLPIVILTANGLIIGLLLSSFWEAGQTGVFLISVLPHGLVELTAVFIGSAVGLLAGWKVFRRLFYKEEFDFWSAIGEMRVIFYGLSLALLLAAAIEVYITARLLEWVL